MMQLYQNPASPYVRKVLVVLHETGQLDSVDMIASGGSVVDTSKMPLAENPLGKIPTLVRDDGPALYDSRVICRYFDTLAGAGLYPDSRLWEVLTLESTADGILDAAILMVYEARIRPPELYYAPWIEGQWAKVTRTLDALDSRWMGHLAGPLDMGQIAVGCALGYIDFRHGARDWRGERPALADWFAEFSKRPSMEATVPVG